METRTKRTILIVSIILVVVINISALSRVYYLNKIHSQELMKMETMKEEAKIRGMQGFIKDELKLSEEQFELFKEISRINMSTLNKITLKLNKERFYMMEEIGKENPNPEALDKIAKEIGTLHYELKKSTIDHFLELKEICNEDQQQHLQKLFMQMINTQDQNGSRRYSREQGKNSRDHGRNRNRRPNRNN